MDFIDLREKTAPELQKLLQEQRTELRTLSFQRATNQLKHMHLFKQVKRTIARIQTLLHMKNNA